jgi:predicted NBD/HSP70 family sugar kinase
LLVTTIKETGAKWEKVKAIGIGAPGFLDHNSGIIENYEMLPRFSKIPLLDLYRLISRKPAFIQNNIYNLAVYDLLKRAKAEKLSIMHVALRSGISAALSLNGIVYRGGNTLAGEAGLVLLPDHKILQDVAGLTALRRILPDLPMEFWNGAASVVKKELRKRQTRKILQDVLQQVAVTLVNIAAFMDPNELIVYSTIFSEPNELWQMFVEEFNLCRKKQKFTRNIIRRAEKSEFIPAIGAAIFALEKNYKAQC